MKPGMIVGIILILLGIVSLAYQGVTYSFKREVIDIGPLQATTDTRKSIPLPPIVGAITIAGGTVLVVTGRKKGEI
jgi:hypothetical protein